METRSAYEIAAGTFVAMEVAGRRTLCMKAERVGKDHTNHFLVPLDPLGERRQLKLLYVDPEERLVPVEGVSLSFADGAENTAPDVGDAFLNAAGTIIKVIDDPRSQRLHAYVDLATGQVRARMEHSIRRLLDWQVQRI